MNKFAIDKRKLMWLIAAFAICFFIGAWQVWRGSYQEYLERGLPWQTLAFMADIAVFLTWIIGIRIIPGTLVVGSTIPAIIMGRIILDCYTNPSDHNLWPFEVLLGTAVGMLISFPCVGVGWVLHRIMYSQD